MHRVRVYVRTTRGGDIDTAFAWAFGGYGDDYLRPYRFASPIPGRRSRRPPAGRPRRQTPLDVWLSAGACTYNMAELDAPH